MKGMKNDMKINREKNRVVINNDNNIVGVIEYSYINSDVVDIYKTFVYPNYRGQGVAKKLMEEMVNILKENDLKCIPSCNFAVSYFESYPNLKYLIFNEN